MNIFSDLYMKVSLLDRLSIAPTINDYLQYNWEEKMMPDINGQANVEHQLIFL